MASLKNSVNIVLTAYDRTKAGVDSASKRFESLSTTVARLPAVLGAVGVAAGAIGLTMSVMGKSALDAADSLAKLSTRTGVSVESLSALQYAGSLADVSAEALGTSLRQLSKNMVDTAGGTGEAVDAFKAMRIEMLDARDNLKSSDQVLAEIADKFASYEDGAAKTALAMATLGEAGVALIPLLNGGAEGFANAAAEAKLLGVIISTETAKAAEAFNDQLTRLDTLFSGVGQQIAAAFLPTLNELVGSMVDVAKESKSSADYMGFLTAVFQEAIVLGANVAYVFKGIGTEIGGISAQIAALARLDFKAFSNIGEAMREDADAARARLDAFSASIRGAAPGSAGAVSDAVTAKKAPAPNIRQPKSAGSTRKAAARAKSPGTFSDYDAILTERIARAIEQTDIVKAADLAAQLEKLDQLASAGLDPAIVQAVRDDLTGATKAAADELERLNSLLAATPTAQLEKARDDMIFLTDALLAARISEEQYLEAVITRLDTQGDKVKQNISDLDQFAIQAARNIQDSFADFLFDPFKDGTESLAESFGNAVKRMIANAVAADLGKRLFGDLGAGQGIGGLFGQVLGGLSSFAPAPAFAVGLSRVPYDMNVRVHKNERIVPAAENMSGRTSGALSLTQNFYGVSGNPADLRRSAGQGARAFLGAINGAGRYE